MASATLPGVATIFPVGTSVKAYKRSNWPGYQQGSISGSPVGSEDATATVASDGSLTFTGLTAGTGYVAYASVGGADKYSRFEAANDQGTANNPEQVSAPSGSPLLVDRTAGTGTVTQVASSASNGTLLAANTARKGFSIFNDSTAVLYVKLGATASTTSYTVQVAAGGYYESPFTTYTGKIDGIWAAANGNAYVTELA